ncbi:hypothetical protein [Eubacterium sp. 1001713B170207_170306_E7]|uniref:hypothetical protein n=1 Tax=Eubacterium sp. 1001713B170207_170306_E7 TaxID=2787097 RepID=UPI00189C19D1|nr:hypothetical protein [Eubacterium sp. 1001713B170207_170306_E7]
MRLAYIAHIYDLKNGHHCINIPTAGLYEIHEDKSSARNKVSSRLLNYVTEYKASTGFFPKSDPHKPVMEDQVDDNAPPSTMISDSTRTIYYVDGNNIKKYLRQQKLMDRYGCNGNCDACELCEYS